MYRICVALLLVVCVSAGVAQWSTPVPLGGPIADDPSLMSWPSINASGDVLYYSKWRGSQQEDICFSTRLPDSTWSAPNILGPDINTSYPQLSPSIGPGDSVLYFVTWGGGYGSWDIWFSRRLPNGRWGTPVNAGPNINSSAMEWGVFLSRDGRSLYFSSDRYPSNYLDIYKSVWQDSGGWGPASPLPGNVNWFDDDQNVTLPDDESFLILTSARLAQSDMDFYYSHLDSSGWTEAERIPELSTNGREEGASLTPDGLTVYIASARVDTLPYNTHLYVSRRPGSATRSLPYPPRTGQLRIYPNPVNGSMMNLSLDGRLPYAVWSHPFSLYVYDVLGRRTDIRMETIRATGTSLQFPFPALSTGKYWLWIDNGTAPLTAPFVILK